MCRDLVQIHKHELRLRMDAAIGRAPPLTDFELQVITFRHSPASKVSDSVLQGTFECILVYLCGERGRAEAVTGVLYKTSSPVCVFYWEPGFISCRHTPF